MADSPVHEWIQEWQNIKPLDIKSYAASLMADRETTAALLRVFEDPSLHHLLDDVCGQLLTFYRSREPNLVHFSLQCLPPLMHAYLNAVASREQKTCKPTETLLLGMYNLEVVDERGQPRVVSFRMPTLIKQSVYHMPLHMAPSSLTEHSLSRLELGDAFSVEWGPLPQAQRIRAANRQQVLSSLMAVYSRYLSQMSEPALEAACRAIIRICGQGFTMTAPPLDPRLTVSPELQLEFLHAIYFIITPSLHLDPGDPTYTCCRYEAVTPAATQALEAVTYRGQYEVNARVTAAANAMRNSLNISPAGLTDSQLNLNEMPSVTSLPAAVNKFIITNASFRTKKLPEDIDPPPEDVADASSGPAGAARSPSPSPAAAASNKLRKGIRSIRRRIRRGRGRSDPGPRDSSDPVDPVDPVLGEGSSSGEEPPELHGSVSTDSFQWILTREEAAEHCVASHSGFGLWRRFSSADREEGDAVSPVESGVRWEGPVTSRWNHAEAGPSTGFSAVAVSTQPSAHFASSAASWPAVAPSSFSPVEPSSWLTSGPSEDSLAGPSVKPSAPPEFEVRVAGDLEPSSTDLQVCSAAETSPSTGSGDGFIPDEARLVEGGWTPDGTTPDEPLTPAMVALELPLSPRSSQTTSLYSASEGGQSSDDTDKFLTSSP